jgi:hypothetical protein
MSPPASRSILEFAPPLPSTVRYARTPSHGSAPPTSPRGSASPETYLHLYPPPRSFVGLPPTSVCFTLARSSTSPPKPYPDLPCTRQRWRPHPCAHWLTTSEAAREWSVWGAARWRARRIGRWRRRWRHSSVSSDRPRRSAGSSPPPSLPAR